MHPRYAEQKLMHQLKPWLHHIYDARTRCNNKNRISYKYYGGRGIKCLITSQEVKELWFRDKAYEMKKPSLDRIDNNGNYELNNCRFIENIENTYKRNREKPQGIPILQYDLNGNFIKEWKSAREADRNKIANQSDIGKCLKGKYKQVNGFIWRYKYEK